MEDSNKCVFQLRRVGGAATCKGMCDTYRLQQGKTLIGRHIAAVDIYLNSAVHKQLISRQHAELHIEHKQSKPVVHLLDKSTNGTFVNDMKIHGKVNMEEGDVLTFGHVQGVQILPGMLRCQPRSEFRFILEKIHCENTPPVSSGMGSEEVCPVLRSGTCQAKESYQLDQAVHSNDKQYPLGTRQDACLFSELKSPMEDSLHYKENTSEKAEKCDRASAKTKNLLVSTGQLQPLTCPKDSPFIKSCTNEEQQINQKHTADKPALLSFCSPGNEVVTCSKDSDESLSMDTDAALQQLSSEIIAKVAHFHDSDLESGSEVMALDYHDSLQVVLPQDKRQATSALGESRSGSRSPVNFGAGPSAEQLQIKKRGPSYGNKKKRKRMHIASKQKNKDAMRQIVNNPTHSAQAEICDSYECTHPTDSTVDWVQCDGCDKWYHVVCVGCDYETVKEDSAAFHCGCTRS